jgi:type I restriction enzyme S subunit
MSVNKSKIKDFFTVGSSKRVLKSDWKSSGVPFYRGREITLLSKNGFVDNDLFITEEMYSQFEKTYGVPKAGDIMITAIGTIGNTYISLRKTFYYT